MVLNVTRKRISSRARYSQPSIKQGSTPEPLSHYRAETESPRRKTGRKKVNGGEWEGKGERKGEWEKEERETWGKGERKGNKQGSIPEHAHTHTQTFFLSRAFLFHFTPPSLLLSILSLSSLCFSPCLSLACAVGDVSWEMKIETSFCANILCNRTLKIHDLKSHKYNINLIALAIR